jgi:hypothetical protein
MRKNSDEEIRDLERAARTDLTVLPRLVQVAARTGSFATAARVLIAAGWEAAAITVAPLDLGSPRDDLVLEIGRELVRRGWGPDLPLSAEAYRERNTVRDGFRIVDRFGARDLVKELEPVSLPGQFEEPGKRPARSWRFGVGYGLSDLSGGDRFSFDVVATGRNSRAGKLARDIRKGERLDFLRRLAPDAWFLFRWDDSQATTTGLRRVRRSWAGMPLGHPENTLYFYRQSTPSRLYRLAPADTPESQYRLFWSLARPYLPGDDLDLARRLVEPPQTSGLEQADEAVSRVRAWLADPVRLESLRALFCGDLWLGGLLIPPEEIRYDPETLVSR